MTPRTVSEGPHRITCVTITPCGPWGRLTVRETPAGAHWSQKVRLHLGLTPSQTGGATVPATHRSLPGIPCPMGRGRCWRWGAARLLVLGRKEGLHVGSGGGGEKAAGRERHQATS